MTFEIKKCPFRFSGSHGPVEFLLKRNDKNPSLVEVGFMWYVECPECHARGPATWFDNVAARMWNDLTDCVEFNVLCRKGA